MNATEYTFLLNRPDAVNNQKTDELERIVAEFPYFQSARALRLKGLYNQNSFQYNYALKIAAAYTTDRSVLFDFITSDTFTTIQKGLYEQKVNELNNLEVEAPVEVTKADPAEDKVETSILKSIQEAENAKEITVISENVSAALDATPEVEPEEIAIPEVDLTTPTVEFVPVQQTETTEITEPQPENTVDAEQHTETQTDTPDEKLGIGRPLDFSQAERHSFAEWLQLSSLKPIEREPEDVKPTEASEPSEQPSVLEAPEWQKKQELIDRFIQNNPKIPPVKQDYVAPAPELPREDTSLMTETLARVYLEQKKYTKAIQAYEILILKYPEKSIFFADRISEIKKLQQNNS